MLLPTAVEKAIRFFEDPGVAKVHWPLRVVDQFGNEQGKIVPSQPIAEGNLIEALKHGGPGGYTWPPTSGNAWSRRFIESVLPIPEEEYKICPDLYLSALAPLYGLVQRIAEPQGLWRIHGANKSWCQSFDERVRYQVRLWDHCFATLKRRAQEKGIQIDPERLRVNSWWHKIGRTIEEIVAVIPPDGKFILVDDDQWGAGMDIVSRHRIPFLERDGLFWGRPPDDRNAIHEAERLRRSGAGFMVFVWSAFWWLDHYAGLHQHLRSCYRCVLENDRVVIFDLGP